MLSYRKGFKQFRTVDLFNKTDKTVLQRTKSGAVFTWVAVSLIVILAFYEIFSFSMEDVAEVITVDNSGNNDMTVFLDMAFTEMGCGAVNLDILDQMGNTPSAGLQKIEYTPFLPEFPNIIHCRSCTGQASMCCDCSSMMSGIIEDINQFYDTPLTCKVFRESFGRDRNTIGCRVTAMLRIPKMKGNIHFAPGLNFGGAGGHSHQLNPFTMRQDLARLKFTHKIFVLSFGPNYPGMEVALKDYTQKHTDLLKQTYFLELVPTIYLEAHTFPVFTHQYSVTNHTEVIDVNKPLTQLPGIFFSFELSPMLVSISRETKSILHLLTRLCAVVGGTWVVLGLVFSALRSILDLH